MHPEEEARDVASMIPKHNTPVCKLQIYHPLLIQCISWVMLRINAIALLTDYGDLTKGKRRDSQEGIITHIDDPLLRTLTFFSKCCSCVFSVCIGAGDVLRRFSSFVAILPNLRLESHE